MNDPAFTTAAYILAEKTPKHLGQPVMPPQNWYLEGANLVVLLADGRKVRGPLIDQKREIVPTAKATPVTSLPIHVLVPVPVRDPPKSSSPKGKKK